MSITARTPQAKAPCHTSSFIMPFPVSRIIGIVGNQGKTTQFFKKSYPVGLGIGSLKLSLCLLVYVHPGSWKALRSPVDSMEDVSQGPCKNLPGLQFGRLAWAVDWKALQGWNPGRLARAAVLRGCPTLGKVDDRGLFANCAGGTRICATSCLPHRREQHEGKSSLTIRQRLSSELDYEFWTLNFPSTTSKIVKQIAFAHGR